jgi:hypothetical protein
MTVQFTARHETAGSFAEYTASVTDGGDLSIGSGAALAGSSNGMSVLVDDTTLIYAYKSLASAITTGVVRYRFYFDPNTMTMTNGDAFSVMMITDVGSNPVSFIMFSKTAGGNYAMYAVCVQDGGTHLNTVEVTITDAPHWIEVETRRATTSTSVDGYTYFWIDGNFAAKTVLADNFDQMNDWQVIIVGAVSGIDAGTSGTCYIDEVVVNDDGAVIGGYGTTSPSIVAKATTNGTTLSGGVALNMPAGITAGDLLIIHATNDNTGGTNMAVSGWTELSHTQYSGNVVSHGIWAKIAAGSDTATLTGASQDYTALVSRIVNHGVVTIATDIKVGTAATGSSDIPNPPSLDAGSVKLWLWIASNGSDDDDNKDPYAPTNYTPVAQIESAQSTSSTQLQVATYNLSTQTQDPGTFLLGAAEEWIAQTIAIPPYVGNTLTLNQVTETDLAQAIAKRKIKAVGQVSETDTAQAIAKRKIKAVGQVSETDTSQVIAKGKIKAVSQVSETDLAQAITRGGTTITLSVSDATHVHATDAITLTLSVSLVVQDATHTHAVDAIALTASNYLTVSDATHVHAADANALTANSSLAVDDATHTHTTDAITLALSVSLVVQDATHEHTADVITLTVTAYLSVQDATHAHTTDGIVLGINGSTTLTVTDAAHDHAADAITLTTNVYLAATDATHTHATDAIGLTSDSYLVVTDATHAHTTDGIVLGINGSTTLTVTDVTHEHVVDAIALTALSYLEVSDAVHLHAIDEISLSVPVVAERKSRFFMRYVQKHGRGDKYRG